MLTKIKIKRQILCFIEVSHFLSIVFESVTKQTTQNFQIKLTFTRPTTELRFGKKKLNKVLLRQIYPFHFPQT